MVFVRTFMRRGSVIMSDLPKCQCFDSQGVSTAVFVRISGAQRLCRDVGPQITGCSESQGSQTVVFVRTFGAHKPCHNVGSSIISMF